MNKSEYEQLLAEIGGGGEWIGEEYYHLQTQAEEQVTTTIQKETGGLLLFGDALCQFYVDTLRKFSGRVSPSNCAMTMVGFHWQIVSCTRFRASFNLWKRGYYFEAATLSRTLWETALTLAGIKKGIVTVEQLCGGRLEEGVKKKPEEIVAIMKEADKIVQNTLIWKNIELSADARSAINTLHHIMNQATHKSNLALSTNISRQVKGQNVPIFQEFDAIMVGMSWNLLQASMWAQMATLAYLEELHPNEPSSQWKNRYEKLMRVFDELNKTSLNEIANGFGEVIQKVFLA